MPTFDFSEDARFDGSENRFITLGRKWKELDEEDREKFRRKLRRRSERRQAKIWGTLGWKSGDEFNFEGQLSFSESGNQNSRGVTLEEIEKIRAFNPAAKDPNFVVTERYINFNDLKYNYEAESFCYDDLPEFRLTVFVERDEGALAYIQHSHVDDHDDPEADVEYILPKRTDTEYSNDRDRLDYHFPIQFPEELECVSEDGGDQLRRSSRTHPTSFIIKVLTYKREELNAEDSFKQAIQTINADQVGALMLHRFFGNKKYQLLKYNGSVSDFQKVDSGDIEPDKKTLLLIHGTFVDTAASFGCLYLPEETDYNLLTRLLEEGIFEQIIAFNHPTVSHDAFQNALSLYDHLGDLRFTQPVDLLGTSRGALVCKWIAGDPQNQNFTVGRVMTFSGANGVGYFLTGARISKWLGILRKVVNGPVGKVVTALAQFSVDFFLSMPGTQQMTPNSPRLKRVLEANPVDPNTRYKCAVADWDKSLLDPGLKRLVSRGLDAIIRTMLGYRHDWVVGSVEQAISPEGFSDPISEFYSNHIRNFDLTYVKINTHDLIAEYFQGGQAAIAAHTAARRISDSSPT